jgi:hypothetical protein
MAAPQTAGQRLLASIMGGKASAPVAPVRTLLKPLFNSRTVLNPTSVFNFKAH